MLEGRRFIGVERESRFLPIARAVEEEATKPEAPLPILIVDDEEVVQQAASAILRNTGYEVALAENGREAVDMFRKRNGRFALVLLDLTHQDYDVRERLFRR